MRQIVRRRHSWAVVAALAAASLTTGCGDDGSSASTVDVVASEYAFDVPGEITGGWVSMHLANQGAEPHEYAIARIAKGHTIDELNAAIEKKGGPPKWAKDAGNFGIQTGGAEATVHHNFAPGGYELLCFLPGPGGKSHLELGMKKGFTVTGDSGAAPPTADVTVAATKDGFDVPPIGSGEQTLEVRNQGANPFGFELASFKPGKKIADVDAWAKRGFQGEAPATLFGGGFFKSGKSGFITQDFESGTGYTIVNPDSGTQQDFTPG